MGGKKNASQEKWVALQVACVITGLIIGAGFASGQELVQFFILHGSLAPFGIIFSGFMIYFTCRSVMCICIAKGITSYGAFMEFVFGRHLGKILNYCIQPFVFVLFCAMLAGTGALLNQSMGIPFTAGVITIGFFCFMTFLFDFKGVIQMNVVLVPIMVTGFLLFGIFSAATDSLEVFSYISEPIRALTQSFVFSALIYSSYNLITGIPVLCGLSSVVKTKKMAKISAAISSITLTVIFLLFIPVMQNRFDIFRHVEIPMLSIAQDFGSIVEYLYIFIMICAIFTTAIADGFVAVEWLSDRLNGKKVTSNFIVCAIGVLIAHAGFSTFIEKIYPVFGVIGIFEVLMIIARYLFMKKST